ncbi:hypothetical protein [uncultured Nocardioides sp.]|uniref:hypothetical protein n=1 Tax=uncultured Nocardioides sp. TaxID=198441 RepID=UPI0025EE5C2F|nr:hypothetical protein [uncultured Nocardioides sp.]
MSPLPSRATDAYGELSTPEEMRDDARVVASALGLDRVARAAAEGAPGLRYDDHPREVPDVSVSPAAARLAGSLHLHLD